MTLRPFRAALAPLALGLALPACAQQSAPPPAVTTTDADPALWVAKSPTTTVYLFGTVHVLKPGLSWFDEAVKAAFDRSNEVVLEMLQPDAATMRGIVLAHAMTPPAAPTLAETLPPALRVKFDKAIADSGVPAATFAHVKPWFAAVNLSLLPIMKAGYDPANGPEGVITAAATKDGKKLTGFETADQQIGYFDGLSQKAQLSFLTSTLDELPKAQGEMEQMVAAWSHGRPDVLATLMNDDLKDSPEVADTLLYARNQRWADWLATRMKQPGTLFVAVGAGHLAGARSVIADLEAKGIKVERVKY